MKYEPINNNSTDDAVYETKIHQYIVDTERETEQSSIIEDDYELDPDLYYNEIVPKCKMYVPL